MNPILIAILVIAATGFVGAVLLVVASKVFAVTEDERAKEVEIALPGANCGGCGYAGCAAYAKAVAEGAPVNLCSVGGESVAEVIASIMGVDAGAATAFRAMVACQGDNVNTHKRYEYHGIPTCAACNVLYNGHSSCSFGCLGFGDCARACKFNAITVVNGLARVDASKCTGCGACKSVCPKRIIFLYDTKLVEKPIVMCSNHKKGANTRKECAAGCLGCGKCVRNCPAKAITVSDNVARIDYDKCISCGKCVGDCPVGSILMPTSVGLKPVVVTEEA